MNCSDPVCQQLMTCKWDMPIAKTWCEAMWYPEIEEKKERPIPKVILEQETPQIIQQPVRKLKRQTEYYGITNRKR
jgi:hypothetical protein